MHLRSWSTAVIIMMTRDDNPEEGVLITSQEEADRLQDEINEGRTQQILDAANAKRRIGGNETSRKEQKRVQCRRDEEKDKEYTEVMKK